MRNIKERRPNAKNFNHSKKSKCEFVQRLGLNSLGKVFRIMRLIKKHVPLPSIHSIPSTSENADSWELMLVLTLVSNN